MKKTRHPPRVFAGFDRADEESPFLSFIAAEFHRRGTPRRLELSKKPHSHPFVASLGMRVPQALGIVRSMADLSLEELPSRFVLKFAKGWSARGVMLLERIEGGRYFDHLSLAHRTPAEIKSQQERVAESFASATPEWLIEEFVESTLPVGAVPFDYKFYCFNGVIGMIGQFDRNANPPRMALFDGNFQPLRHGKDYIRSRPAVQRGIPLVPLHAPEMMWWAQELSRRSDAPFVSIDMYDSPSAPVFGEFTYSPGGTHRRMFQFSHEMIDQFDSLFMGNNPGNPLRSSSLELRSSLPKMSPREYRALAGYAYNVGPRGAERLSDHYREQEKQAVSPEVADWMRFVSQAWQSVRTTIQRQLKAQTPAPGR